MIGSGQPTLRRVASSSTTIRIVPMIQSIGQGLPTRNAGRGRPRARRGWRRRPRWRSSQSTRPMPPAARSQARGGDALSCRASSREDEEDQAEHEGDVDAAMGGLPQQAEAGRVVVEAGQRRTAAPATIHAGRRQQRPEPHLGIELLLELRIVDDRAGIGGRLMRTRRARVTRKAPPGRVAAEAARIRACDQPSDRPASL